MSEISLRRRWWEAANDDTFLQKKKGKTNDKASFLTNSFHLSIWNHKKISKSRKIKRKGSNQEKFPYDNCSIIQRIATHEGYNQIHLSSLWLEGIQIFVCSSVYLSWRENLELMSNIGKLVKCSVYLSRNCSWSQMTYRRATQKAPLVPLVNRNCFLKRKKITELTKDQKENGGQRMSNIRAIFDQVPNVTHDYLGFGLFRSMIGPENSCQTQT